MRGFGLVAGILVFAVAATAARAASPEVVHRAEGATALVRVLKGGKAVAYGSAFCIDDSGLFITNNHVADGKSEVDLVIDPGQKTQRIVAAKVIRADAALDLAELQVEGKPFTALVLGNINGLIETQDIIAFGYPFGEAMSLDRGDFPSISVNTGRITSLRKKAGELELIQIDALVNPGNSGGPVVDTDGKVVGIVEAGIPGSGVNFAIPINRLDKLLQQPKGTFTPAPSVSAPFAPHDRSHHPAPVASDPPVAAQSPAIPWAQRLPIPSPADQAKAQRKVEAAYKTELAAPRESDRVELAKQLIDTADQTTDDTAGRYMLLCEARTLAAQAGEYQLGDIACHNLADHFQITLASARQGLLESALASLAGEDASVAYVLMALHAADDALLCDDFVPVPGILKSASDALHQLQSEKLAELIALRNERLRQQQKAYIAVKPMMDVLAARPDDPETNLAAGKYVCFVRGDWETGLPMLTRGSDAKLKQAAEADLADPPGAEEQAAVANLWYILGKQPNLRGDLIRLRAYYWYQMAQPQMTGAEAHKNAERINELASLAEKGWGQAELWLNIRESLKHKDYEESDIVGGAFARDEADDLPAAGDILVGFRLGPDHFVNNVTISYVQPIYLTPKGGEVFGHAYGALKGEPVVVKAKPGYAVGSMVVHGGGGLDSIQLTFMKIGRDRLDPTNAYASAKIGGDGGGEKIFDGNGVPLIGIRGRQESKGDYVGLGVVYMLPVDDRGDSPRRSRKESGIRGLLPTQNN